MAARRGKKRAIIAIGHSILKSIYYILKDNVRYKELGADYLKAKMESKRKKYLRKELEKLGFKVELKAIETVEIET